MIKYVCDCCGKDISLYDTSYTFEREYGSVTNFFKDTRRTHLCANCGDVIKKCIEELNIKKKSNTVSMPEIKSTDEKKGKKVSMPEIKSTDEKKGKKVSMPEIKSTDEKKDKKVSMPEIKKVNDIERDLRKANNDNPLGFNKESRVFVIMPERLLTYEEKYFLGLAHAGRVCYSFITPLDEIDLLNVDYIILMKDYDDDYDSWNTYNIIMEYCPNISTWVF